MRKVGLFEAKQKLSELVERAGQGERIGITRRGKLAAVIGPAQGRSDIGAVFEGFEAIQRRAKKSRGGGVRALIEEGRS